MFLASSWLIIRKKNSFIVCDDVCNEKMVTELMKKDVILSLYLPWCYFLKTASSWQRQWGITQGCDIGE